MANRLLIYIPEIDPNTFLFFYYRGDTGRSYSLRNYMLNPPGLVYAESFPYSAEEIILMARYHFDAEVVSTDDVSY